MIESRIQEVTSGNRLLFVESVRDLVERPRDKRLKFIGTEDGSAGFTLLVLVGFRDTSMAEMEVLWNDGRNEVSEVFPRAEVEEYVRSLFTPIEEPRKAIAPAHLKRTAASGPPVEQMGLF